MDWEQFRNKDGSLDILQALQDRHEAKPLPHLNRGYAIVSDIIAIYPIKSRQLAATIFVLAIHLSVGEE